MGQAAGGGFALLFAALEADIPAALAAAAVCAERGVR